jgi:recombinational DNA repair protein RecT
MASNIATTVGNPAGFQELMAKLGDKLVKSLPSVISEKRFTQLALVAGSRTAHFFECTGGSIAQCVMQAAELGLPIGPTLGLAYLIPRKNKNLRTSTGGDVYECTIIVGYKGWAELARRSGEISYIDADVVYKGDTFKVERGLTPSLVHVPDYDSPERNGAPRTPQAQGDEPPEYGDEPGAPSGSKFATPDDNIIGSYAVIRLKGVEQPLFVYLSRTEILKRKSRSAAARFGGPWSTDFSAMCRKSAILALLKGGLVPLSPEVKLAMEVDQDDWEEIDIPQVDGTIASVKVKTGGMDKLKNALGTTKGSPLDPLEETAAGEEPVKVASETSSSKD